MDPHSLLYLFIYFSFINSFPLINDEITESSGLSPFPSQTGSISEYTHLFDTLNEIVKHEYKNEIISHSDEDERIDEEIKSSNQTIINIAHINNNSRSSILFQGDIRISVSHLKNIIDDILEGSNVEDVYEGSGEEEEEDVVDGKRIKREAIKGFDVKWSDGVPYAFHPFLTRQIIEEAISYWQKETCIQFRPRFLESQYLYFLSADGCWSTVGKDSLQGQQWISIAQGCEQYGVVSHEIGHALGLFHEQSRYDRDNHLTIDMLRVQLGYAFQFAKVPPSQLSTYGLPYDIGSIMHYAPSEFSALSYLPALKAKDPYLQSTMGQLSGPSFVDIAVLNTHYKCNLKCPTKIHCSNKGYQDSRNCDRCKCPSGFGGIHCRDIEEPTILKCGGILNANESMRQLTINIKHNLLRTTERRCVYHITAPRHSRSIEITIKELKATCMYGCWKEGLEIKSKDDPRPIGYRFCCNRQLNTLIVSYRRILPLFVYSHGKQSRIVVHYRYIPNDEILKGEEMKSEERMNGTISIDDNDKIGRFSSREEEIQMDMGWNILNNGTSLLSSIRKNRRSDHLSLEENDQFDMDDMIA